MLRSLVFLLVFGELVSQNKAVVIAKLKSADTVFSDCAQARVIRIGSPIKIGPTIAPASCGANNEISHSKQGSKFVFETEHHSAWYRLDIAISGHLCFDIIPKNSKDDYDFMLFKAGKNFCDSLHNNKIKPLRACISRDKEEIEGITGLNNKAKKELVKEGVGDSYVKPLAVVQGETYYLVLDNVYDKGDGHSISFYFSEPIAIKGIIKNEEDKPVRGEVSITNSAGDTICTTKSKADGTYELKAFFNPFTKYAVNYYSDGSFMYSQNVKAKDSLELKNIKTILPQLKKGKKYTIGSINFFGGAYKYLPQSLPCIKNLARLMSKNPSLEIMIVGHVNGCSIFYSEKYPQELSEKRALEIKKFLIKSKIDPARIKTSGMGCKEMLYPDTEIEWQAEQNRRVEVLVLNY